MSAELSQRDRKEELSDAAKVERTFGGRTYTPRIDIWETDEELVLFADLPGVTPESLDIQFENRELRLHGRVPPRQGKEEFVYGEYGVGDFYRTFTIGEMIDSKAISAELSHGVLTLRLPKTEAVKPRKIAVKSS